MKSVKNILTATIAMTALVSGAASADYTTKWCSDNIGGLKIAKETCDDNKKTAESTVLRTLCMMGNKEFVDAIDECEGKDHSNNKPAASAKGGKK
jgi:hypothetical protein